MNAQQTAKDTDMLSRAKWLIANARHAAMATVNENGSPHNTPYFFICSDDLSQMYWVSEPSAQHSQNLMRTGEAFIALYDAHERGGAYIKCTNAHIASEQEANESLAAQNKRRSVHGQSQLPSDFYDSQDKLIRYVADAVEFWYYDREKDDNGHTIKDIRRSVSREDLV